MIEDAVEVIPIDAFFADLTEVGHILSGANNVPAQAIELENSTKKLLEDFLPSANEPFYEYATVIGGLNLEGDDAKIVKEVLDQFQKEVINGKNKLSKNFETYLEGLSQGNISEIVDALDKIYKILEDNQNELFSNPGGFVIGIGKGFGQGLLNNADEIWEIVKSSFNIAYLLSQTYYYEISIHSHVHKILWGEELPGAAKNRKEFQALVKDFKEKAVTIVNLTLAVGNLIGKLDDQLGDKAQRVLEAIASGDEQAIKDLGDEDGKLAVLLLSLALDVLDQFKDLSAEDQGIIYGKIVAELGVIVAGTLVSGGASNAAKAGKLAVIADKLKSLDKAGKLSDILEKVFGKKSRFKKKLDEYADNDRRGHSSPPDPVNNQQDTGSLKKSGVGTAIPQGFEDLADKASEARQLVTAKGSNSKMRRKFRRGEGNIAVGELDSGGLVTTHSGFSGHEDIKGFTKFVPNEKRALQTGGAKNKGDGRSFLRDVDPEAKILEQVLQSTPPNATGTLRLFTEKATCRACSRLIENFQKHRPYIKVELGWKGGKLSLPARRGE